MSQLQFHCPASPLPAAPAPLQLGQPQPGYSIPCASSTLPSESASQPIRSSALPAGSATPYIPTTGKLVLGLASAYFKLATPVSCLVSSLISTECDDDDDECGMCVVWSFFFTMALFVIVLLVFIVH